MGKLIQTESGSELARPGRDGENFRVALMTKAFLHAVTELDGVLVTQNCECSY